MSVSISEAEVGTAVRRISNSEASVWLSCQRQYYYKYTLGLYPKNYTEPLTRGVIGHDALAVFYETLQQGHSRHEAGLLMRQALFSYTDRVTEEEQAIIFDLDILLAQYVANTDDSDWEIVAVEREADLPLTDRYNYVLRFDLLVRIRSTGKLALVDHKFVYNFWTADEMAMSPQFPKYMATLRANGVEVDHCILNEIRHRKLKSGIHEFRRTRITPSRDKMRNGLKEQIAVSEGIANFRELSTVAAFETSIPVRQSYGACKYCMVKALCLSEFDGGDITHASNLDFQDHDKFGYGYNKIEGV